MSVTMFGQLLKSRDEDRALFDEFVGVCGRLQIFSAFDFVELSAAPSAPSDQWTLLNTPPGALLTIEEPKTGIHPGLLFRPRLAELLDLDLCASRCPSMRRLLDFIAS